MENVGNEKVIVITFDDVDVPVLIPYVGGGYIPTGKEENTDSHLHIPSLSNKRQKGNVPGVMYSTYSTWFLTPRTQDIKRVVCTAWSAYTDLNKAKLEIKTVAEVASKALIERSFTDMISPYMPEIDSFKHRYTNDDGGYRAEINWTDLRQLYSHVEDNIPYFDDGKEVLINFNKSGDVEISFQRPCNIYDVCDEFEKARKSALSLKAEQDGLSSRVNAARANLTNIMNKG